jgi:hypothetical protein
MSVEAGQDQEGRRSEDESKRDGKRKEEERTYVSETVLNVFLAPWNQPRGANWFDAYHQLVQNLAIQVACLML